MICFIFAVLVFVYILNLEQGLISVLAGLYFVFVDFVLQLLVIAFGVPGGLFSVLALKRQGTKTLNVITLVLCSVFVAVSASSVMFVLISVYLG